MTLFKNKYRIESTRLRGFNYARDGAYFITICTKNKEHHFGKIIDFKINSLEAKIAEECWFDLPYHYPNCILDEFIVMPNHVHGIIIIDNQYFVETGFKPVSTHLDGIKPHSLSEMVRAFKTFTARRINEMQNEQGRLFWQTRFYDRIIRNENEFNKIKQYIINNPNRWGRDRNNSENVYM